MTKKFTILMMMMSLIVLTVGDKPGLAINSNEELNVAYEKKESLDSRSVKPIELLEPLPEPQIKPTELLEPLPDSQIKPTDLLGPDIKDEREKNDLEKRIEEIEPKLHEERSETP